LSTITIEKSLANEPRKPLSTVKMVKTASFGSIQVPTPGFGAMGLSFGLGSNLSLEEAEPVLLKAIELGCTFWDTAVSQHVKATGSNSRV
jgi:predicted aldo/keto reductase-like oxidoreductase